MGDHGRGRMIAVLTVHEIGRTGHSDATVTTRHPDPHAARTALFRQFDPNNIRGDELGGTVGSLSGRVFQASHVWSIREEVEAR